MFLLISLLTVFSATITEARASEASQSRLAHESEIGTVIVKGNSKSETVNLRQETSYSWLKNKITFGAKFLESEQDGVTSAKSWDALGRYDRQIDKHFGAFVSHLIESNRFAGYVQRDNSDLGMTYKIYKDVKTDWSLELGYRNQHTKFNTAQKNKTQQAGRLYTDIKRKFNESTSGRFWVEYIPNFSDSKAYIIKSEPSLSVVLTQIMSLKLGYLVQYQNQIFLPQTQRTDTTFTTSLVAKF